jgi:hypothetical protein
MEDKLVVSGVHEDIDGEHPCDILGMLTVGHPDSLTNRELHKIKLMTGIVAGNLFDAINDGDMDATVGFAAVILTRNGKVFQDDWLWDAPMGASLRFEIKAAQEDEVPPAEGVPESTPTVSDERSGGGSSERVSDQKVSVLKPTGDLRSGTSVISAQEISGI